MIDRVAGNKQLPPGIQQDIVERADGVPLFVEEMTKAVLEAEGEGAAARAMASIPSSALAVPASLHASLMARLDRLGNAKAVAQIGAAIGREFSHDLLAAVAGETEAELVTVAGSPRRCGAALSSRVRAACDLSVQACARPGHRLRHAAAGAPPRAAQPDRERARKPVSRGYG